MDDSKLVIGAKKFFDEDLSLKKIAKELHICEVELGKYIKSCYGIDIKEYNQKKLLNKYEMLYQEFTLSEEGLASFCRRNKISAENLRQYIEDRVENDEKVIKKDKYEVNTNAFSRIDSEEKAYWLGFLYADGYNSGKYVQLTITKYDYNHMKKYRTFLKSNHPIHYRSVDNTVNITISDSNMANSLSVAGCVRGKTYCSSFPGRKTLPKVFVRDFVRGYFDGDGCIYKMLYVNRTRINTQERQIPKVQFTIKSERFADGLIEAIKAMCGVEFKKYRYKTIDRLDVYLQGQVEIRTFLDCIYKESSVFLTRKYKQYLAYTLPSYVETDKIISAELSGDALPDFYDFEKEINRAIRTEGVPKELEYGDIFDSSNANQGQRVEDDALL